MVRETTLTQPGTGRLWKALCIAAALAGAVYLVQAFRTDRLELWLFDFEIFWRAGRRILAGTSPYRVKGFISPLPLAVLFAPLGLLPMHVAYGVFVLGSLELLWKAAGHRALWALLSFPVIFTLFVGQVDLVLALAAALLGPLALPLLLAKPQVAFVAVPWMLRHGVTADRRRLAIGIAAALGMLALCFWLRPSWIAEWRKAAPPLDDYAAHDSNLYRLVSGASDGVRTNLVWILTPIALALGLWLRERRDSWAVLHLFTPITNVYSTAVLAEWIGPLEMLLSWAAFVVAGSIHGGAPMFVVALSILWSKRRVPASQV